MLSPSAFVDPLGKRTARSPGPLGAWPLDRGAGGDLEQAWARADEPHSAMRAATVLRLTLSPASCRSVVIRGAP